jgi:hypothetical protein
VYASSRLPNGLDQNDSVRVYGQRYGNNDIRNANVSIIGNNNDNRWNNNGHHWGNNNNNNNNKWDNNNRWGNYQTFTGTVTEVESNSEFEVRIGGSTYDVYPSGTTQRVNKGDTVRIYGQRSGNNDIRNANVVIISNGNNGNWNNNNNNWGNYQTFTGTVTEVKSSSEFEVRIGSNTYDVYQSGTTRRVNKGNIVRIYGRRYGNDDIRNANVVIVRNR